MSQRFNQFPSALAANARWVRLGPHGVPSLLIHPDWKHAAPTMVWMHGRTANKELDAGRYLRWMRAGIATCAVDLPGHGERADETLQHAAGSLRAFEQMHGEIDGVLAALAGQEYTDVFDASRLGIGGMSLGGMIALRRLCEAHPFIACAVECTTGWLGGLYSSEHSGEDGGLPPREVAGAEGAKVILARSRGQHDWEQVAHNDAAEHLSGFVPLPLLILHNRGDRVVPWPVQARFVKMLREHYLRSNADPELVQTQLFEETGAADEHAGFGRYSNDAKNAQTVFLSRVLRVSGMIS